MQSLLLAVLSQCVLVGCSLRRFIPEKKYKLALAVTVLQPSAATPPTILFQDLKGKDRRLAKKTKVDIEKERKAVEAKLDALQLPPAPVYSSVCGDLSIFSFIYPSHRMISPQTDDDGNRTLVFAPKDQNQPDLFHTIKLDAAGYVVAAIIFIWPTVKPRLSLW